jgi:serine protease inhibitor
MDRSRSYDKKTNDISNMTLNNRSFELNMGKTNDDTYVNKRIMERNDVFNSNATRGRKNDTNALGEITGDDIHKTDVFEHGMPVRGSFSLKRNSNTDLEDSFNRHLDFNIFDEDTKPVDLNLSCYDPKGSSMFNFTDTQVEIVNKTDPIDQMGHVINDFNWFMYENMRMLSSNPTFYNIFGLMSLMGAIYYASKGATSIELKNYFNFPDRDNMFDGIDSIKTYISKSECFDMKNIILINNRHNVNKEYVKYIDNIAECYKIDVLNPVEESNKINSWLNKLFSNTPGVIMNVNHIEKLDVTLLNTGLLRTVWKQSFDRILLDKFRGNNSDRTVSMMIASNKTYDYYEDPEIQAIEFQMFDNVINMGIILPKNLNKIVPNISLKQYETIVKNLKPSLINQVAIPKFKQQCKLRVNSIFQKSGLKTVFEQTNSPELIVEPFKITDIIQNFTIIVDETHTDSKSSPSSNGVPLRGNIKFIANKPFIYYFKCATTNTIIITGTYY